MQLARGPLTKSAVARRSMERWIKRARKPDPTSLCEGRSAKLPFPRRRWRCLAAPEIDHLLCRFGLDGRHLTLRFGRRLAASRAHHFVGGTEPDTHEWILRGPGIAHVILNSTIGPLAHHDGPGDRCHLLASAISRGPCPTPSRRGTETSALSARTVTRCFMAAFLRRRPCQVLGARGRPTECPDGTIGAESHQSRLLLRADEVTE